MRFRECFVHEINLRRLDEQVHKSYTYHINIYNTDTYIRVYIYILEFVPSEYQATAKGFSASCTTTIFQRYKLYRQRSQLKYAYHKIYLPMAFYVANTNENCVQKTCSFTFCTNNFIKIKMIYVYIQYVSVSVCKYDNERWSKMPENNSLHLHFEQQYASVKFKQTYIGQQL